MAKQTGLGDGFMVGALDFSGDIQSLGSISGGNSPLDMTGINKSAKERQGGIRDGKMDISTFFNPAGLGAGISPIMQALPTTDVQFLYARGTAIGSPAASLISKQTNYDGTRGDDGSYTFACQALANGFGLEWGELHTAMFRTDSAATNGAGVDGNLFGGPGGTTNFGLQAYLHFGAFTGTSCTVKLQESSDNGGGDAFADVVGGAFTAVTSAFQVQRIATATNLAVERYLRVVTTGTFSNATFVVSVVRNISAPSF